MISSDAGDSAARTSKRELEMWASSYSRNFERFPKLYDGKEPVYQNDAFQSALMFAPDSPQHDLGKLRTDALVQAGEMRSAARQIAKVSVAVGAGSVVAGLVSLAGLISPHVAQWGGGIAAFLGLASLSNLGQARGKEKLADQLGRWERFLSNQPDIKSFEPPPPPPKPKPVAKPEPRPALPMRVGPPQPLYKAVPVVTTPPPYKPAPKPEPAKPAPANPKPAEPAVPTEPPVGPGQKKHKGGDNPAPAPTQSTPAPAKPPASAIKETVHGPDKKRGWLWQGELTS